MNITDTIEVKNLINTLTDLTEVNKSLNKKYVDQKVVEFANNVITDHNNIQKFITITILDNIELFYMNNNGELCIGLDRVDANTFSRGYEISIPMGNLLHMTIKLNNPNEVTVKPNSNGYTYKVIFSKGNLSIRDIHFYTSDTSNPKYDICSAWSITRYYERITKLPLNAERTIAEWNAIYKAAFWGEKQNKLNMETFLEVLKNEVKRKVSQITNAKNMMTNMYKGLAEQQHKKYIELLFQLEKILG